jgi:DNA repair protein RecO (recombination protein O)
VDERTTGIVLRIRPLTESSLIVHWLTRELGRVATVAKGACRPKSPFRGKLDLFYLCEFSFARSRRSDLHTLREVSLQETHTALRRDLGWLEQATRAARLVEQKTETETPLPEYFHLLVGFLKYLPEHLPQPQTVFAFEMKLLRILGLSPNLNTRNLTAGAKQILEKLDELDWPAVTCLKPTAAQIREMEQFLRVTVSCES